MSEDCHESNNPRPVVDKSVNLAQQPHDTADVYDEQEPPAPDVPDDYDPVYLNDFGGGNVSWWFDYIRAEIGRCNDHWREQWPDEQEPHTAANQMLDDLRRKAMGQPVAWAEWAADEAPRQEDDHE